MKHSALILMVVLGICLQTAAQHKDTVTAPPRDSYGIPIPVRSACKGYNLEYFPVMEMQRVQRQPTRRSATPAPKHSPILQVHGNILYDLNYRSNIDTPYTDREVYQHMAQSYLDITYKDQYPFRIFLTTRFSNSSWFRNFTDVNLQYNANDFNNRVRREVKRLLQVRPELDTLTKLKKMLLDKEKQRFTLRNWLDSSGQLQRLIAAREDLWFRRQHMANKDHYAPSTIEVPDLEKLKRSRFINTPHYSAEDSLRYGVEDSITLSASYDSAKSKLDELDTQIASLGKHYHDLKQWQDKNATLSGDEIEHTTSGKVLQEKLRALHISDSSLPKGYQTLYSVKSFGIGRTMIDYSELSAKNISITGIQFEYNPAYYMAVAAGLVDYRFRDYTMGGGSKGQYIGLVRYGWGSKEKTNVILTGYTGRRQLYNSYTTAQSTDIPNYNLMGFTIEGHYAISRTSMVIAEVAKSSAPYYSMDSSKGRNVLGSALKMNDRTNEAWSLKFSYYLPRTSTQFDASYRRFGANFQSFSLFTTGVEQTAWSVRVDQPLFDRRLQLTGSIRTNDFSNPLVNASYKSSTVFKSIQATLRLKKWPILSAGYFPSSQIIKLSNDQFQENLFYTLTGSASYVYKVQKLSMMSMLLYTQFYNKVTDTNFVYFNTKNLLFSQNAFLGNLTLQLQLSAAINTVYSLYVIDQKADYKLNKWLSLGAGIKYNRQTVYNILQWGYSGNATIRVPRIGEFRLQADKGFIPGNNRQLVVNKIGRLTYFKVF